MTPAPSRRWRGVDGVARTPTPSRAGPGRRFSGFFRTTPVGRAWDGAQGASAPKIHHRIQRAGLFLVGWIAAFAVTTAFTQRTDTASPS